MPIGLVVCLKEVTNSLKLQVGIEPTIFRLEGGRDIHFATGAGKYANR
uniref:Uncharacterized protein n=1 Tax=viral metagenome TaxID=1070528 RepID=A0A6C0KCM7_9ZZZZ